MDVGCDNFCGAGMSGDPRDINPYASPAAATVPVDEPITREEALHRLRNPAIFLAASSVGSLLWAAVTIPFGLGPPADDLRAEPWLWIPVIGLFFVLPAVVLLSAISIARQRTRPWLWVAIVLGLIPFGTGCTCSNMVFSLWLLHLAMQRPIRAALRVSKSVAS